MDSEIAERSVQDTSSEETLLDAESIATESVADLSDFEDNPFVEYDEETGDIVVTRTDTIPSCDIPDRLPIVSQEQIWEKERTVIVRQDPEEPKRIREMMWDNIESSESEFSDPPLFRQVNFVEAITSESDWSDHNNNQGEAKKEVIPDWEDISEGSWALDVEEVSEGSLEISKPEVPTRTSRDSPCPLRDCEYEGRKLKFHVQQMHLPRLMWDNPQPPLKEEKHPVRDQMRHDLLLMLAETLTGVRDLATLVEWTNKNIRRKIPRRSEILSAARSQMLALCQTVGLPEPYRYTLVPIHSPCILIHWRYQILLFQELPYDRRITYLSFGWNFMSTLENLTVSPFEYAKSYSLLACILAGEEVQEEEQTARILDDEGQDNLIKISCYDTLLSSNI